MTPWHPQRGFTLLELVVSVAVGALFLALLSQALGLMMQASRSAASESARHDEQLLAERVLTQLLKSMLVLKVDGQKRGLIGGADQMTFYATPPESLAYLGLVKVRVFSEAQQDARKALVLDISPISGGESQPHVVKRLMKGLTSVAFSYIPAIGSEVGRELNAWREPIALPGLVKLSIEGAGGVRLLNVAAKPRRELGGDCEFSVLSLECR